ncbi:SH2 domain-containing protein 4B isoform X1 [Patella vulgata]|uniref:SH2 domain-containing protein 4B isoform X1 n=1 Tax=Patella vulgata TaxID=6465 RepID=UPI0024A8AA73|nr:SH2 domain-containing protein 4B isoform X1 [Patella vulgata]XP_050390548.2 SH2 domain-containing protein 4B isoform X1 [Patella vulgata]XP_050390549.2 SH2 domain-containing protein 4B isoform X1 [Patella vulgata]XP_050390550.2 SH2 domain-containing protein 4B isoform X1 [Patella vulgata]XP_050390551.2 SH2 domain-containing protein 4B isoform X1 [Patella vulgata]
MLEQILKDMYIEPALLNELNEDQKQQLFIKLREEQKRRYREHEREWEEAEAKNKLKPKKSPKPGKAVKTVKFLTGKDNREWVWVMGEHPNDQSIEHILQKEAQEKAVQQADKEAEELRKKEELELRRQYEEEKRRLEKHKAEKEAEIRRKREEAELYQTLKEARLEAERLEKEKKKTEEEEKKKLQQLQDIQERNRKKSVERADTYKNRRSTEIYSKWKENREMFERMAIESNKEVEKSWKEQEKKAKEAEQKRREMARQARKECIESLKRVNNKIHATNAFKVAGRLPPDVKPPLPPKRNVLKDKNVIRKSKHRTEPLPPDRQSVVEWFVSEEKPKGAGIDPDTGNVAEWFHGIISRTDAERLLEKKAVGSFIVRVSERVWGYTISYKAQDRLKHFLIDTSEDGYQFFGANQVQHETLSDLVKFHKETSITVIGEEKLLHPCGQIVEPPDHSELFHSRIQITPL